MLRRAAIVLVAVVVATTASAHPVGAHEGSTACTYDAATKTVRLHLSFDHVVRLIVVSGRIEFADLASFQRKGQCGTATNRNTDTIRLTEEQAGTSRLQLGEALGKFAPGATLEATGKSEIEIELGTVRAVTLGGTDNSDRYAIGSAGISVNTDDDVDIIGTITDAWLLGNAGNDIITGRGAYGSGAPLGAPAPGRIYWFSGGDGNDQVRGGDGGDVLDGDWGDDIVNGYAGADDIDGGGGNDTLYGVGGNDTIDGGYGLDTIYAGTGNDTILAHDETADTIDGSSGTDYADVDSQDSATSVETLG